MSPDSRGEVAEKKRGRRRGGGILELVILVALPLLFHVLVPITIIIPPPYSYLGVIGMLLGPGLMVWAGREFRKAGTGFELERGGSVLVTSGPFRFSRNPMYLGMLVWLTGLAVLLGSLVVFIFPVLVFLLAQFLLIPIEEKRMEEMFGEQYIEYRRQVRRWV